MDIPVIKSCEDRAIDAVVCVINRVKDVMGIRQNLMQIAQSRNDFLPKPRIPLKNLGSPLAKSSEKLIVSAIEMHWKLTPTFMYVLRYISCSSDECSVYYYYEAVFSQPTAQYPIPQVAVSVFFRVEDKHVEPPETQGVPLMFFRIEGQHTDHDIRYVFLTVDWILAAMKMKLDVYKRIEGFHLF